MSILMIYGEIDASTPTIGNHFRTIILDFVKYRIKSRISILRYLVEEQVFRPVFIALK